MDLLNKICVYERDGELSDNFFKKLKAYKVENLTHLAECLSIYFFDVAPPVGVTVGTHAK